MEISTSYSYGLDKPKRGKIVALEAAVASLPDQIDCGSLNTH